MDSTTEICRLCMLNGGKSMETIFSQTDTSCIADMIASVTKLTLFEGDGLPVTVCQKCLFQLETANTFIQRCTSSDKYLRSLHLAGVEVHPVIDTLQSAGSSVHGVSKNGVEILPVGPNNFIIKEERMDGIEFEEPENALPYVMGGDYEDDNITIKMEGLSNPTPTSAEEVQGKEANNDSQMELHKESHVESQKESLPEYYFPEIVYAKTMPPQDLQPEHCTTTSNVDESASRVCGVSRVSPPSTLLEFSIRDAILKHPKGKELVRNIEKNNLLVDKKRSLVVRIVVAEFLCREKTYYPSAHLKLALAKAITDEFPCLRSSTEGGRTGYEQFYDANTHGGFIEYRLKTLRRKLMPSEKKYKRLGGQLPIGSEKPRTPDDLGEMIPDGVIQEKINLLKSMNQTPAAFKEICEIMRETFTHRRAEILLKALSITEILFTYPRLADFNGAIIDLEFKLLHPKECNNFLEKFSPTYTKRILKYCELFRTDMLNIVTDFKDENLQAIMLLSLLLPPLNCSAKQNKNIEKRMTAVVQAARGEIDLKGLLQFVKPGELSTLTAETDADSNQPLPYLVCEALGPLHDGHYFIVAEKAIIDVGMCPVNAFDKLFKAFFVFNVGYNFNFRRFFNFIETRVFALNVKSGNLAAVEALDTSLLNMKMA